MRKTTMTDEQIRAEAIRRADAAFEAAVARGKARYAKSLEKEQNAAAKETATADVTYNSSDHSWHVEVSDKTVARFERQDVAISYAAKWYEYKPEATAAATPTTTNSTTATVVVRPGMEQQVRELRAQLATINDNISSMDSTIVRIGERDGWGDPRIAKIESDIDAAEGDKLRVRAKIAACMMVEPVVA